MSDADSAPGWELFPIRLDAQNSGAGGCNCGLSETGKYCRFDSFTGGGAAALVAGGR